ncbi:hypothetical protein F4808DRAFT_8571 [Astrocystis sublimbata]|nr:hypothetical protein F4808DRAFT_8571 [Astrocystis sublimbata]
MYFPDTKWTRLFLSVALIQSIVALSLEAYVLITVEDNLAPEAYQVQSGHTVPMYASLFIFGFIYQLVLFYDALRLNSMIQVIGLCLYNVSLLIYSILQPRQIQNALDRLELSLIMGERPILNPDSNVWHDIEPFLLVMIAVLAVGTVVLCFLAYKLQAELAWSVYKVIHADISMRRRVIILQVHLALVKFDFFFIIGFLVQNIVHIVYTNVPEFGLSIGATFFVLFVAIFAIVFNLRENKLGTGVITFVYFLEVIYLVYKLVKLSEEPEGFILALFAGITIFMHLATIVAAVLCFVSYGKGLKAYAKSQDKLARYSGNDTLDLQNTAHGSAPFIEHRMTLD